VSDRLPRPEPRDAFKRALRAQLMAQAPTVLMRRETAWSRFQLTWGSLMRPALAVGAVVLVLIAGAGKAAADSLPGDLAFGLKAAAEQVQLALALDEAVHRTAARAAADSRVPARNAAPGRRRMYPPRRPLVNQTAKKSSAPGCAATPSIQMYGASQAQ